MTLQSGTRLGPYEILSPLGAGGMGEVYLARDTRLQRQVAVKILPAELHQDPERRERFEREAKVISSLGHPSICALFDVGSDHGVDYLVMELVEGETLAARIARLGRLEIDDALAIALQIAAALESAHGSGIIHRDLKPGNVMVSPGGQVKVLDFGLAKAYEADPAGTASGMSRSPTMAAATAAGVILGTASYMSPEQARGQEVDRRTDIWAFGAVLYEMLPGSVAFGGPTVTDVLASVVKDKPDWTALPPRTPPLVASLLRRCLRKDPARRLHDVADARIEIEEASSEEHWTGGEVAASAPRAATRMKAALVGALVWAIAASAVVLTRTPADVDGARDFRFTVDAPDPFHPTPALDLSPDGSKLVFTGMGPEGRQLWVRHLDAAVSEPIPGTRGAFFPFWAPNGDSLAYFQQGSLVRHDLPGTTRRLADAPTARGGSWGADGVIVFSPNGTVIYRVPADGSSEATPVTALQAEEGELDHRFPNFLPDGRRFTFFNRGLGRGLGQVWVGSIDAPGHEFLRDAETEGVVVPGYLLFVSQGILMAQPFDHDSLDFEGEAIELSGDMASNPFGNLEAAASYNGVLAYRSRPPTDTRLAWFDRSGGKLGEVGVPGLHDSLEISPDGEQVAFTRVEPAGVFIYLLDLNGDRYRQVTLGLNPTWMPDSESIVFRRASVQRITLGPAGEGTETLIDDVRTPVDVDVSATGAAVAFVFFDPATNFDIWAMSLEDGSREPLVNAVGRQDDIEFSPDGEWLAYVSDHSGTQEVYVISMGDRTVRGPLSVGGGVAPKWRGDSGELFYLDPRGVLMAVRRENNQFLAAEPLLRTDSQTYTVSDDGERLLLAVPEGRLGGADIQVVTNWTRLVNRR